MQNTVLLFVVSQALLLLCAGPQFAGWVRCFMQPTSAFHIKFGFDVDMRVMESRRNKV